LTWWLVFAKIGNCFASLESTLICTHAFCADGFGAQLAAWLKYGNSETYHKLSYGGKVPDFKDKDVFMADFSLPLEALTKCLDECRTFTLLDHHASAISDYFQYFEQGGPLAAWVDPTAPFIYDETTTDGKYVPNRLDVTLRDGKGVIHMDIGNSGAILAWKYLHPEEPVPLLFLYLDDRDRWVKRLPHTDDIHHLLLSVGYNRDAWLDIMRTIEVPFKDAVASILAPTDERYQFPKELWTIDPLPAIQKMPANRAFMEGIAIHRRAKQQVLSAVDLSGWAEYKIPKDVDDVAMATLLDLLDDPLWAPFIVKYENKLDPRGDNIVYAEIGYGIRLRTHNSDFSLASEIGEALAQVYGGVGVIFVDGVKGTSYSLRSRAVGDKAAPDVTKLARIFGGGGHPQAAGFKTKKPIHIWETV
jgi:hypothetical protein